MQLVCWIGGERKGEAGGWERGRGGKMSGCVMCVGCVIESVCAFVKTCECEQNRIACAQLVRAFDVCQ